jgi:hypothetical protein
MSWDMYAKLQLPLSLSNLPLVSQLVIILSSILPPQCLFTQSMRLTSWQRCTGCSLSDMPVAAALVFTSVLAAASLPTLIDQLVKLYSLRQPLLSRHTSEVLGALAGSSSSHINPQQLQQLLALLIDGEAASLLLAGAGSGLGGASGGAGGDQLSAVARLLESGLMRLCELSPEAAGKLLPKVVHLLVPLVSA